MRKIPTLFKRDELTHRIIPIVTPGCEWVMAGEGVPTQKVDGTAVLITPTGDVYRRYELKLGKIAPEGFMAAQEPDETGNTPGWVPMVDGPADQYLREALERGDHGEPCGPGTYELLGPKVNANPERAAHHYLERHGSFRLSNLGPDDLSFDGLAAYLAKYDIEGIVWWRDITDDNCPKVKVKRRDFGLQPNTNRETELRVPPLALTRYKG